jgi:hypothetical protein
MATKRNSLAGKSTGKSESAKYFASHPEARAKKIAYAKKYNARPDQKKYRAELNRANKKAGTYGKMTKLGKDRSHKKDGKMTLEDRNKNRARNGKNGKSTKK